MIGNYGTVAVVGSRDYPLTAAVLRFVRSLPKGTIVVSGGARGVDSWAESTARSSGNGVLVIPVNTEGLPDDEKERRIEFGKRAYARNKLIIDNADIVVAFHDGRSPGTKNAIALARAAGKPVTVYGPDGKEVAA